MREFAIGACLISLGLAPDPSSAQMGVAGRGSGVISAQAIIPGGGIGGAGAGYMLDPVAYGDVILIDFSSRLAYDQQAGPRTAPESGYPLGAPGRTVPGAELQRLPNPAARTEAAQNGPARSRPVPASRPVLRDAVGGLAPAGLAVFPAGGQSPRRAGNGGSRRSLLDRLQSPLLLPVPAVSHVDPESARSLAGTDYSEHLLGQDESNHIVPGGPSVLHGPERVFVVLELKLSPAEDARLSLRSIVLRAVNENGFSLTSETPVLQLSSSRERAFVRGWIDAREIQPLLSDPGIVGVSVEYPVGLFAQRSKAFRTRVFVSLKVPEHAPIMDFLSRRLLEMERTTGFGAQEVLGRSPLSPRLWIVSGEVPVANVTRLMRVPGVVRLDPVLPYRALNQVAEGSSAWGSTPPPVLAQGRPRQWISGIQALRQFLRTVFVSFSRLAIRTLLI